MNLHCEIKGVDTNDNYNYLIVCFISVRGWPLIVFRTYSSRGLPLSFPLPLSTISFMIIPNIIFMSDYNMANPFIYPFH